MTFPQSPLAHFRAELYQTFGLRRDALQDLLDAVLTGDRVTSLVRLSVAPAFRRNWPSVGDALADGTLDVAALRRLSLRTLPRPAADERALWAIDGSTWPRPEAKTSPERTCCRFVTAGIPESGIVPGWEYQWLVTIPEPTGSWVLPLDVSRRSLAAVPEVDLLARLARNRRFYRAPPAYAGTGRPRVHGPVFRLGDPATHHAPDAHRVDDDPDYGTVTIDLWSDLHTQPAPDVAVTVIRVSVAHLPRHQTPPKPLWLVWHGDALPDDLRELWRWYQRRFAIEHAFRFLKQDLGWTVPRLRSPLAADRWSWLLASALWQLWLGRAQVVDARLPWERPTDPASLSPGRVRRGMAGLVASLGTPARPPRPRGKSPGRHRGAGPGRAPRFAVQRRAPPAPVSAP